MDYMFYVLSFFRFFRIPDPNLRSFICQDCIPGWVGGDGSNIKNTQKTSHQAHLEDGLPGLVS